MLTFENHKRLASIYKDYFDVPRVDEGGYTSILPDLHVALQMEQDILETEDQLIKLENCPVFSGQNGAGNFVAGLKRTIKEHVASHHPFYESFLPNKATIENVSFYLAQETLQDPRFDDFIAYLQIGLPVKVKLELASNFWDEMGNGVESRVHTVMFQSAIESLGITDDFVQSNLTTDGLLCGNLSALLVLRRHLIFRAIGYFAAIEFLFPVRCLSLMSAWKRLGLPPDGTSYHNEHVKIDALHAFGFFNRVIRPLVEMEPECAKEIYWGVCARLNSSARHLDALMETFESN